MSGIIEKTREGFLKEYGLGFEKEFCDDKENERLNEIVFIGEEDERDKILESYDYDFDTVKNKYRFYRKVPINYSKEELDQFINIKMLEYARTTNQNSTTIKNILLFWLIITILWLIIMLISILGFFSR